MKEIQLYKPCYILFLMESNSGDFISLYTKIKDVMNKLQIELESL